MRCSMKPNTKLLYTLLLVAALMARAGNYEFRPTVIANGGGVAAGGPYTFSYNVGQQTLGPMSGGNYSAELGFWPQVDALAAPVPPVLQVTRSAGAIMLTWDGST